VDIIFGVHPVVETLKAKSRAIDRILIAHGTSNRNIQQIIDLSRAQGIPVKFEPRSLLDRRSDGGTHQGVLAVCAAHSYIELEQLLDGLGNLPMIVLLDSIEDPRNLGAILRTCAVVGADGVVIPKDHAAGLSATVAKTAAGALNYLKVAKVTNVVSALKRMKERRLWIAGVETGIAKLYFEVDYQMPLALVFGNEATGIRRLVRESCDFLVSVPAPGPIHSLNVSVAAGVVLFEVLRQRHYPAGHQGLNRKDL
jgi:23S rRNA (guanosine2251-2'-O)-methyltransferase